MPSDILALIATIGLATAQLTLSSILTLRQLGGDWVLGPREGVRPLTGLAGRIARAHANLLEIFPQFAAALFAVHALGAQGQLCVIGAWTFFAARLAYVAAYAFGPPGVRPVCWVIAQIGVFVIIADCFV